MAGTKFMIPLVIDHLMSTCFRGAQNPVDSGRPEVTPTSRLAATTVDGRQLSGDEDHLRLDIRSVGVEVHLSSSACVT